MITVFWNPNQIALVDALPKGEKFNASYYTSNILEKLHHLRRGFPDTNGKKLNVHADKSRPHTSKHTIRFLETHGMKKVPHPAFSPSRYVKGGYAKNAPPALNNVLGPLSGPPKPRKNPIWDPLEALLLTPSRVLQNPCFSLFWDLLEHI